MATCIRKRSETEKSFFLAVALTNVIATFSLLLPPLQVRKKTSTRVNCWSSANNWLYSKEKYDIALESIKYLVWDKNVHGITCAFPQCYRIETFVEEILFITSSFTFTVLVTTHLDLHAKIKDILFKGSNWRRKNFRLFLKLWSEVRCKQSRDS